jgi:methylthioribose-1-phosphate isomerase
MVETMRWEGDTFFLLDQTKLPHVITYLSCQDYLDVKKAIQKLIVRGAPAIGAAAAYGLALGMLKRKGVKNNTLTAQEFYHQARTIAQELRDARPTAVNLSWALNRMLVTLKSAIDKSPASLNINDLRSLLLAEAKAIYQEDLEGNKRLGQLGQTLVPAEAKILTHCNAGALATAGYGTALGVIRAAVAAGKKISIFASETRPLLQGARLTTFELLQEEIPVTLITDGMTGFLMARKMVDLVIVGADRIAANGDVANKIGTYSIALGAREHNLPFYVAAPVSTLDLNLNSGQDIPIEEREPYEITHFAGQKIAPCGVKVWNPAFDLTPGHFITAIITDRGIVYPPYNKEKFQRLTNPLPLTSFLGGAI